MNEKRILTITSYEADNPTLLTFIQNAMEDGFCHIEKIIIGMPPAKANHLVDELDGRIFVVKNGKSLVGFIRTHDKVRAWNVALDKFPIPRDKNPFGEVGIGGVGNLQENKEGQRVNTSNLEIRELESDDFSSYQLKIELRF